MNNRMVAKPTELTPLTALLLADILYEAGLPSEMLSIVTGNPRTMGDAMITDAELVRDEDDLREFLKLAPYYVVIEPQAATLSITHRIRQILGSDFRQELPSFEELTGRLNMSPRTLRRRLEKEGTSYQRIKDNARRDVAITLLSREGLTVSEVAEQVGFSDPSAFHRSFKKWTGQSPGSYR